MRILLFVIFVLISSVSFGQNNLEHEIYSVVVDNFVDSWDFDRDTLTNVVILDKLDCNESDVQEYAGMLRDYEDDFVNWLLDYDTTSIRIVQNINIKNNLTKLQQIIWDNPRIDNSKLNLKTSSTIISQSKYKRFFWFGIKHGWKKFYRKFPNSAGVFSFSKVAYSGNYACLYVENMKNGLAGSGRIVILEKQNEKWIVMVLVDIWLA